VRTPAKPPGEGLDAATAFRLATFIEQTAPLSVFSVRVSVAAFMQGLFGSLRVQVKCKMLFDIEGYCKLLN
jgi:hypothetical protein